MDKKYTNQIPVSQARKNMNKFLKSISATDKTPDRLGKSSMIFTNKTN